MTVNVNARTVLLLNASYEPLGTVTVRHAVELMLRNVVDAVDGIAATLRTSTTMFEIPSVLRLRYYVNVPRRTATWGRRAVLIRDGYRCVYCGKRQAEGLSKSDYTVDHIIPVSHGGKDTWSNTACACWKCNNRKADRTPHGAGMRLLWEPKRPRTNYLIASGDVPDEWKVYLEFAS